ncbi:MAG: hypothetical protein AVDCRST_MAG26-2640 [uncultured Chloroflexia bacterium]|uniref:Alkaline phosphatase n=1 Tax=uncultured Chloroflexia bacterium TaxID=1672391 RepID=A0A6J4J124_9CHLR|nr:MAG: hypothetical protein AVDCRST_MAG26-2640 [uncultured Chloroflexia bacterium]
MAVKYGTQGSDILIGTYQDDVIRGWAENGDPSTDLGDQLAGYGGNDELDGGGGNDTLFGKDGALPRLNCSPMLSCCLI